MVLDGGSAVVGDRFRSDDLYVVGSTIETDIHLLVHVFERECLGWDVRVVEHLGPRHKPLWRLNGFSFVILVLHFVIPLLQKLCKHRVFAEDFSLRSPLDSAVELFRGQSTDLLISQNLLGDQKFFH